MRRQIIFAFLSLVLIPNLGTAQDESPRECLDQVPTDCEFERCYYQCPIFTDLCSDNKKLCPSTKVVAERIRDRPRVPASAKFGTYLDLSETTGIWGATDDNYQPSSLRGFVLYKVNINGDEYVDYLQVSCGASACDTSFHLGGPNGTTACIGTDFGTVRPQDSWIEGNTVFLSLARIFDGGPNGCPGGRNANYTGTIVFDGTSMVLVDWSVTCP